MKMKKSEKKIEKFCRFQKYVYLCNPFRKQTSEEGIKNNIADVAQLARARDL